MTMFFTKQSLIGNLYFEKIEKQKKMITKHFLFGSKQSLFGNLYKIKIIKQEIIFTKDCHKGNVLINNCHLFSINFIINSLFYKLFSSNPLNKRATRICLLNI